jgi:hypothetical protein
MTDTEPAAAGPSPSEPDLDQPGPTAPGVSELGPAEPGVSQLGPAEPGVSQLGPAEPGGTERDVPAQRRVPAPGPDDPTQIAAHPPLVQHAGPAASAGLPAPAGPTGTSVLPAVDAEPGDSRPPRWSARAQVRAPAVDEAAATGSWEYEHEPRGLLVPVLVVVCVLLLTSVAGLGVWLILRSRDVPAPPEPTAVRTTTGPQRPTTPPARVSSAPPTTPATSAPALVTVPDVRNLDVATATAQLQALGLVVSRQDQPDAGIPAGLVVGTSPPAGEKASAGSTIVLVVSTGPPSPTPTLTPTKGPSPTALASS